MTEEITTTELAATDNPTMDGGREDGGREEVETHTADPFRVSPRIRSLTVRLSSPGIPASCP